MIPSRARLALLVVLALLVSPAVAAEKKAKNEKNDDKPVVEQFTGTLGAMPGAKDGGSGDAVTIWIEEYTSDDVKQSLVKTLADEGQSAFRDAARKLRAGRMRIGKKTTYPIAVARQRIDFENLVVVLVTDSPLGGFQLRPGLSPQDFPIGVIELTLRPDGTGEGIVAGMAKVEFDREKNLHVAGYGAPSVRLSNVETVRKK